MSVKQDIDKLINVFAVFRKLDSTMPTQIAQTVLCVALRPGLTMEDLEKMTGMSQSACSRNVAILGPFGAGGRPGHDLIEAVPDPREGRRKIMFLSPKGRKVMQEIIQAVHPGEAVSDFESPTAREFATLTFQQRKAAG